MRCRSAILLVLVASIRCACFAAPVDINGWYPCTLTDIADQSWLNDIDFECATVEAPLCHSSICNSSKTIELFVKRKRGTRHSDQPHKSIWFLAGGPGASSADLELAMLEIYALSNSSLDVYTMDHRGTGRSSFLDCVAAQALAEGSPDGRDISLEELPYCIDDILHQIEGNTEAFSVTSAARDVTYLLDGLAEESGEIFIYGVSYGTFLVERVMHLAPPRVKGYILDGVVSESGPDANSRLFFSDWDHNIVGPSRRLLELCLQQPTCPLQLDVSDGDDVLAVLNLYDELDEDPNDCAKVLMYLTDSDVPTEVLRPFMGLLVRDATLRELVPSILSRMQRCSNRDLQELSLVLGPLLNLVMKEANGATTAVKLSDLKTEAATLSSLRPSPDYTLNSVVDSIDQLVYTLISFSELWATPSPTEDELEQFYEDGVFSLGSLKLATYCLVSGQLRPDLASRRDPACYQVGAELEDAGLGYLANSTKRFVYELDNFSNRSAVVPPNTSLLMINGGLDFQTPWEFGRYQFDSTTLGDPDSSEKMLVDFDYGAHACGLSATTKDDETVCGPRIVSSFISASGNTQAVDTACMSNLPDLVFTDNMFAMLVESLIESEREQMLGGGFR